MATEQTDKLEELTAANDDICPPNCECKYCWAEREIQSLRDELRQQNAAVELLADGYKKALALTKALRDELRQQRDANQRQIDSWPKARKDIVTLTKRESAEEIESLRETLSVLNSEDEKVMMIASQKEIIESLQARENAAGDSGFYHGLTRAVEIASKYGTDQGDDIRDAIEAEISKQDP